MGRELVSRPLGAFEKLLLFALLAEDEDADGASIRRHIEERTGRAVSPGAVYTAMDRLQERGLVDSEVVNAPPELGGRRQKRYRLEPAGALALDHSMRELSSMADGLRDQLDAAVRAARGSR